MDTRLLERCALALTDMLGEDYGFVLITVDHANDKVRMVANGAPLAAAGALRECYAELTANNPKLTYMALDEAQARKSL